jgi:hypothetical protein
MRRSSKYAHKRKDADQSECDPPVAMGRTIHLVPSSEIRRTPGTAVSLFIIVSPDVNLIGQ